MPRLRFPPAALALLLAACHGEDPPRSGAPSAVIALVDSVALAEDDSTYIGAAATLTAGADGEVYVGDAMNGQLLQFDREGRWVRRFGRSGTGPGELTTPLASALVGDSLLAVADQRTARVSLFSLADGAFVRSAPYHAFPVAMQAADDTLWLSGVDVRRPTSLARWSLAEDSVVHFGPVPAEYRESRALLFAHPYAAAALLGADSLLLGFTGHPRLFLARHDGTVVDTLEIPAVRRRGVPDDMVARFAEPLETSEVAAMVSALVALHRLPDGEVAALYLDVDFDARRITAAAYLSVLSADLRRACVDVPVPTARDGRPVFAFSGDELRVLEPRVTPDGGAVTTLRTYRIDASGCDPLPIAD